MYVHTYTHCYLYGNYVQAFLMFYSDTVNYTASGKPNDTIGEFLEDQLKGEFCYVQTRDGKIASIHFSQSENQQSLNIKKGIAAVFQANFDNAEKIIESDPGSSHISHYK